MPREIFVPEASASLTSPQPSLGSTVTSQIEFSSQLSFEMNAWCSEKQEIDNHDFLLLLLRSSLSYDTWGLGSAEVLVPFQLLALSKGTLLIGCLGIHLHLERWQSRSPPPGINPKDRWAAPDLSGPKHFFLCWNLSVGSGKNQVSHPDLTSSIHVGFPNKLWNRTQNPQMSQLEGPRR